MFLFNIYLTYQNESFRRPIAQGYSKDDVCRILNRHIMLAEVAFFEIEPCDYFLPFKEFTL